MKVETKVESDKTDKSEKIARTPVKKKSEVIKKSAKKNGEEEDADVKVNLSAKAKPGTTAAAAPSASKAPLPSEEKELKEAETLMSHVNGGKLSAAEQDSAMKRVGEILRKYTVPTS